MDRRLIPLVMGLGYGAMVFAVLSGAQPAEARQQKKAAPPPVTLPEGAGKELTQKDCGTCHAVNVWTNQHHTRDQWSSVIDNMVSKGLKAPDDDLDTIADYLAANFGPVTSAPVSAAPPSVPPGSSLR